MRTNNRTFLSKLAASIAGILLSGAISTFGQQQINLTAGPSSITLPDGNTVPMWGYTCGAVVTGSTATCAPLNTSAFGGWSPVVITVPTGASGGLTINLTNNLSFANSNSVPTSIMITGQVGGGLGSVTSSCSSASGSTTGSTCTPSPNHPTQGVTWSTVNNAITNVPPPQGPRVQSFGTEVAAGSTAALTWPILKPGTYLLESGTHPSIQVPMGLYGILVVTTAPTATSGTESAAGTAYPACPSGTTTGSVAGCAASAVTYDAEVPLVFGEIDPVQNSTVSKAVNTAGFSETMVWSGQPGGCGNSSSSTYLQCYPPAVNYTPLYYTINGVAFSKTNASASLFPITPASIAPVSGTGSVLVRLVNAGLRMHVPAIVGSKVPGATGGTNPIVTGFQVIAEDGNPLPGVPKIKSEVFMAAGKTYDVIINGPAAGLSAVSLVSGGSGYNLGTTIVTLSGGGGTGAIVTPTFTLSNVSIAAGGTGYVAPVGGVGGDTFTVTGSGTAASGTITVDTVDGSGAITRVHVTTTPGSFQLGSTSVTYNGTTGSGATLVPTFSFASIGLSNPGSGYTSAPTISIADTATTPGTGAAATASVPALPVFDRELSLSGNATERDAGMLAYIGGSGAALAASGSGLFGPAVARPDTYNALAAGVTLKVLDPSKGVIANDTNVYGASVASTVCSGAPPTGTPTASCSPAGGALTMYANGTFTYTPNSGTTSDWFIYQANGNGPLALVTLNPSNITDTAGVTCSALTFNAQTSAYLAIKTPGVLAGCKDGANLPLTVATSSITAPAGLAVVADANGGFTASLSTPCAAATGCSYTFTFQAQNSQKGLSPAANATVVFPAGSGLSVTVLDGQDKKTVISDYRWIIEEDRTFYIDPKCTANPPAGGCPTTNSGTAPTLGTNFHTSYMPYVAQGCTGPYSCEGGQTAIDPATGRHIPVVCDVGNGVCRPDTTGNGMTPVLPSQVALDPTKRYYISVLPGDAAQPFTTGYSGGGCQNGQASATPGAVCGHGMGGAPIAAACAPGTTNCGTPFAPVTIITQPAPYPPGKLSVFVFEDDFPLNGEQDGGGGVDVLSPIEPGLGGFQIHLWDAMGGNGDFTGQMTYDMFNQPLTNSLAGTKDPNTGLDACPIGVNERSATSGASPTTLATESTATGITGMIVTCPKYESDGVTLSPLAGQAVIANLMPGRWGAVATPGADRIARGEEWLQTNTLDGQKAHDVFTRVGEPSYFQEFGPASYHVSIGFANPAIINARKPYLCAGTDPFSPQPGVSYSCNNTLTGRVTGEHLSRTPDERLYSSGSHDTYYWSQCYVSFGDPDGEDFAFTKCNGDGTFTLSGLPPGDWRVTVFDQWNDLLVDGLSTPVSLPSSASGSTKDLGDIATTQWQTNLYTRTFIDDNKDGISQSSEAGIPFANVAVRLRDGSLENLLQTDFTGTANFNETFPLFGWYTVETDVTRYKNTGTHVVYDVGGPTDGSSNCGVTGYPPCGNSTIGKFLANTAEIVSVPTNLRVPGAVYCAGADCNSKSIQNGPSTSDPPSVCATSAASGSTPPTTTCSTQLSSGRIDPPWVGVEGWQGFPGQNNFLEFGKEPYVPGENGGIKGHVIYASTRPFDDPQMLVQTQWEPLVPHVTINLYQEGVAADGVTPTLTLVDHTQTTSWDDWAQGFHADANGNIIPNMSCPGQGANSGPIPDLFFSSLYNQPNYLDFYNNVEHGNAGNPTALPNNSQFKCYDGMHAWNQIQPAPYDGMYQFPSVTSVDPTTGKPKGTNCTICQANNLTATTLPTSDLYYGLPQLPTGKYVVEVVLPPGYELVKEEDKNILIGDNFIAPVTQEFGGLGNVFIIPDQASVAASQQYAGPGYNQYNAQNPTQSLGASAQNGIVPGFIPEPIWPCVGEARIVPDYISLYPQSKQVSPFAGATRNLCDRKEVTLGDQMGAIAKFYIYTSTHIASKFTGGITDDYTSEFDPFSPQFGEKFAPPNLPVSVKDWAGNEISRVYADQWGTYDGMTYSTWEVNPPNPTGYSPTMMVFCMNDPGPIPGPGGTMIPDPQFTPGYSQFCYELPFMPGTTQYLDTPVVPTSAFAGAGYNNVDCAYPDATPAIAEVDGDGVGPWVSKAGVTLTITALGNQNVPNNAYSGPSATAAPFNQKTVTRHYGFGNQCLAPTPSNATCNTLSSVTIGGKPAVIVSWSDTQIQVAVPPGVAPCPVQQQAQYGGSPAQCGQLVITAGNGKQSIDTVTVTIGGKAPTHVPASGSIQTAIDAAAPGDLIIVDPTCVTTGTTTAVGCTTAGATTNSAAAHNELVIMWKPVRLQGVGSASSIINANTHPAGKLDAWRQRVNCLFGLNLTGTAISTSNPFDPTGQASCPGTGWNYFVETANNPQVDPLPLEAIIGWDATQNGNLAQLLQEPSLMGALEGAAITVLGKGVNFPSPLNAGGGAAGELGGFPTGTTVLTGAVNPADGSYATGDANPNCETSSTTNTNPFPSNFSCNPSSIDALGITDSSQGGGGIFLHGWAHNMQIANNHIFSNAGTLSGGINLGQGEFAPSYIQGSTTNAAPGSCVTSSSIGANVQLPYCNNLDVNVHNNNISLNSSTGDELFSGTPAGAGGVSICTGADYYKFNNNWVCGNLSSGDGGGVAHMGFSYNGDIEHNTFIFNQSLNPTIPANGGGLLIMGTPDVDATCGATVDVDCLDPAALRTPSDGVGPGLVINANLIMGNAAETGSGGGLRLQQVNGSDVLAFPTTPSNWYSPQITNNIIADNVAGWDGGGVSMVDALNVNIINNTIVSNSTTASAGILFTTIGAPLASGEGTNCVTSPTTSCPQPAGLVAIQNSAGFAANLPATITCPPNHYQGSTATNGTCRTYSYPELYNNAIWQNSAYYIGVGALSAQYQQNVVSLYNAFTTTMAPTQPQAAATTANGNGVIITGGTGACVAANYWDIGVRGDATVSGHESGVTLNPLYSVLSSTTSYDPSNISSNPTFVSQYCDGSRQPPEFGSSGWAVPPGIADATVPNPVFNLTPVATVDEGNNWINLRWGPLTLTNPSVTGGASLGNYALAQGSPAIDYVPSSSPTYSAAPSTDFFGKPRPDPANPNHFDIGAVEFQGTNLAVLSSITPNSGEQGTVVPVTITGTYVTGATAVNVSGFGITVGTLTVTATSVTTTFTIAPNATVSARNVTVTTPAGTSNPVTFSVVAPPAPTLASITPYFELRGTSVNVTLTGTNFVNGSTVRATAPATGFIISSVVVVNQTTITATFSSTTGAPIGNESLYVATPGGTSNVLPFAINGPVLSSISPASGNRDSSVAVTLTGTGLTGTTAVNVSGSGIVVSGVTVVSDTTVTATFTLTHFASGGARNVTTTSPAGTSNAVTFTVIVPPGALTSISPTTGAQGTSVPVTISGTGLTGSTGITFSGVGGGGGIGVSGFTVVNDTAITATFAISPTAALTARNVRVNTAGGLSNPETFTVVSPGTPTLTSISPSSGLRGTPTSVTLTGTGFTTTGTAVHVTAPANGLSITGVTVVNPTTITATFNTSTGATIGPRSIYVTTPGGTTGTVTYTVSGPVLTSISPTSAVRGTAVSISLFGSGLTGTTAINVSGGGVTVGGLTVGNGVTVVNDGQVNATFTISAGASGTVRNVTVTAPGGTSNSVAFTVVVPPAPTLTSIAPPTGVRGQAVSVTLNGTNLTGASAVNISGGGITVSGLTIMSPTAATATFTISNTAALGARNVTITTSGGTSNVVPFTIQGATITSITPNSATHPATGTVAVPVQITGSNLTGATGLTGLGGGGGGITVSGFTVVNATTITATLNVSSTATTGIRNIGVTTPIGTTNALPFTVN